VGDLQPLALGEFFDREPRCFIRCHHGARLFAVPT
jgi:hypothetical protein